MKKLIVASMMTLLFVGCGTDEDNVDRTVSYYKTAEGLLCERYNADNLTLCYDQSGKIVKVDDPNGVLSLYERDGVDTVD